jgi:hypothetical protein
MEKGEKEAFPYPSIGHQAWNIPLATKFWIYFHLLSSLEKATWIIKGLYLKNIIFYSNLEKTCSHNLLW